MQQLTTQIILPPHSLDFKQGTIDVYHANSNDEYKDLQLTHAGMMPIACFAVVITQMYVLA